jgi:glycosyltransferase involved in cell wall biosynthesis
MRISVVLPVYDGERFLAETLDSLRAQTRRADEVVAVDDGSTDRSAEILADCGEIELIRQIHAGVAEARNAGVARTTGDVIVFLDQDDVWHPERVARAAVALESDPGLGMVVCAQVNFLTPGMREPPRWLDWRKLGPLQHGFGTNALMVRRDVLSRVGAFDPNLVPLEDSEWFVRALDAGVRYLHLDEPLVRRRIHDRNLSAAGQATARGKKLVAQILHESIRRRGGRVAGAVQDVDVVIPVFNCAQYLAEAIENVLGQTTRVRRVVVVDDGSTDASVAIASRFGAQVEVLRRPHLGIGAARNAGVEHCDSSYLAFLDADDRWHPHKIERQMAALAEDCTLDFVLCRMRAFASPELPADVRIALEAQQPEPVDAWVAGALLIRRAAFDRVGLLATDLGVGEMIDWFDRARHMHLRWSILAEDFLQRRLHRHNTTRLASAARSGYLHVAKRHLDRIRTAR